MILEELMHERFATYSFFKDQMAVYAGLPAVFYQGAPDDRQKGWEGEQYPRIVYTIDMQADEERKSAGVMQVDLYCDERKTLPEDIEPYIRKCLVNLIVKPEGNSHYAFAWARTEMFSLERSAKMCIRDRKQASGNIFMEISVPKGQGVGAWVNPLSGKPEEYEFLLNRGTDFLVTDIGPVSYTHLDVYKRQVQF